MERWEYQIWFCAPNHKQCHLNGKNYHILASPEDFCLTAVKDLVVYGGIIHTIDKVLSLPIGPIQTFVAENLSYFIAIAEEGGYISGEAQAFVSKYLSQPNTTYFVFNSAKALADLNNTNVNKTMLLHSAGYGLAPQVIYSTSLVNGSQIITDLGLPVFVTVQDGDTYFNAAKVISFDNFISNGVFHVIDE